MTEHSIEELKRQVDAAASKAKTANEEERAARRRLHDRKTADSGLKGKIATSRGIMIVVNHIDFSWQDTPYRVTGPRIKKDGSLGQARTIYYGRDVTFSDHPVGTAS